MRAQGTAAVESSPVPRLLFVSRAQPPPPLDGAPRAGLFWGPCLRQWQPAEARVPPPTARGHVKPFVEQNQNQKIMDAV